MSVDPIVPSSNVLLRLPVTDLMSEYRNIHQAAAMSLVRSFRVAAAATISQRGDDIN